MLGKLEQQPSHRFLALNQQCLPRGAAWGALSSAPRHCQDRPSANQPPPATALEKAWGCRRQPGCQEDLGKEARWPWRPRSRVGRRLPLSQQAGSACLGASRAGGGSHTSSLSPCSRGGGMFWKLVSLCCVWSFPGGRLRESKHSGACPEETSCPSGLVGVSRAPVTPGQDTHFLQALPQTPEFGVRPRSTSGRRQLWGRGDGCTGLWILVPLSKQLKW